MEAAWGIVKSSPGGPGGPFPPHPALHPGPRRPGRAAPGACHHGPAGPDPAPGPLHPPAGQPGLGGGRHLDPGPEGRESRTPCCWTAGTSCPANRSNYLRNRLKPQLAGALRGHHERPGLPRHGRGRPRVRLRLQAAAQRGGGGPVPLPLRQHGLRFHGQGGLHSLCQGGRGRSAGGHRGPHGGFRHPRRGSGQPDGHRRSWIPWRPPRRSCPSSGRRRRRIW